MQNKRTSSIYILAVIPIKRPLKKTKQKFISPTLKRQRVGKGAVIAGIG